jgi:hypothetical protein
MRIILHSRGQDFTYVADEALHDPPTHFTVANGGGVLVMVTSASPYRFASRLAVVARLASTLSESSAPITVDLPTVGGSSTGLLTGVFLLVVLGVLWTERTRRRPEMAMAASVATLTAAVALAGLGAVLLFSALPPLL